MDSIRGYVKKVSEIVSSVIDEADVPSDPSDSGAKQEVEVISENPSVTSDAKNAVSGPESTTVKSEQSSLFGWLPGLQRSAEHYMNSLAGFGVVPDLDDPVANTPSTVITEELTDCKSAKDSKPEIGSSEEPDTMQDTFSNWMTSMSSRTEEVWKQIKHDLNEMVITVSKEPKEVVTSVYQHISAATAEASSKLDTAGFHLLPENKPAGEDTQATDQPGPADLPSLDDLRTDVKQLVNDFVSNLFGPGTNRTVSTNDRREARLQILRADPVTYEVEPPLPPAHLNLYSYTDWRAAYFDETTCQPLPGIPLFPHGSEELTKMMEHGDVAKLPVVEPAHPSPEELLEAHPFIGSYLTQLVGNSDKGITDGDFWSRYYYRVWLMDVTEARRQLLAARFSDNLPTTSEAVALGSTGSPEFADWQNDSDKEEASTPTFSRSPAPVTTPNAPPSAKQSPPVEAATDQSKPSDAGPVPQEGGAGHKRGKHRRRNRKTSEKSDRKLSESGGEADAKVTTSPSLAVEEGANKQQVCESDESSSIVVLGNGDEEARRPISPKMGENNSDEWTDVVEAEEPTVPGIASPVPSKSSAPKRVEDRDEADDWVEWS